MDEQKKFSDCCWADFFKSRLDGHLYCFACGERCTAIEVTPQMVKTVRKSREDAEKAGYKEEDEF